MCNFNAGKARVDALVASKHLPFRDPVTQLFNKEFFYLRLDLAVERSKRRPDFNFAVAVLSVAIDGETDLKLELQKSILAEPVQVGSEAYKPVAKFGAVV